MIALAYDSVDRANEEVSADDISHGTIGVDLANGADMIGGKCILQ